MSVKARVTVFPRPEFADLEGEAVAAGLARLGYRYVTEVRAGKSFEIAFKRIGAKRAEKELTKMCEDLLSDATVEECSIELLDEDSS